MRENVFDVLKERGFVQQVTDETQVRALLGQGPVTVYVGYDPTADSLHVGNLFTLMALKHLENSGHRPIAVLGTGTAQVGDPSGKTELRQMLSREQIFANVEKIREQVGLILDVAGSKSIVVENGEWLLSLNYIDFLREVGRHFSVNRMLSAESYKQRLERGLSFIEFNYQILQAYDFLELRRRLDCRLQMGGDDQWGNILAGVDLCRRMDQELVHGMTFPLLLTATGEKMGKTAAGAVWLDSKRLSPFDYYQFWVNVHDDDVVRLLGYYTFLPMSEIKAVAGIGGAQLNLAKSILAFEATTIVHGAEAARAAHQAAQGAFGGREVPSDLLPSSSLPRQAGSAMESMPTTALKSSDVEAGIAVVQLLVQTGLVDSKNDARRLIGQGAVSVGERKLNEPLATLQMSDFVDGSVLLRVGKKKVHRLTLES